jgi:hypothetical protein
LDVSDVYLAYIYDARVKMGLLKSLVMDAFNPAALEIEQCQLDP